MQTPFCAQCAQPLTGYAPPYPAPVIALMPPGAMALVAPGLGPSWPYPEPASRKASSFDKVFGFAFVGAGVFAALMAMFVIPMAGGDWSTLLILSVFVFGFPAIGIGSLRAASKNARTAEELTRSGLRCWGRILSTAPGGAARSVNGMRWQQMKVTVEAYAAHDPRSLAGYRQHAAGTRVADRVVIDWYISMFQMAMLQPGHFCAFLLHPTDPSKVFLDSLATPQGQVVPLT